MRHVNKDFQHLQKVADFYRYMNLTNSYLELQRKKETLEPIVGKQKKEEQ